MENAQPGLLEAAVARGQPIKAVAFDLGDTLVEYEGLPLSWEPHYAEALGNLAESLGVRATPTQIECGCAVLRRYNTRLNPRQHEVSFAEILRELAACFETRAQDDELRGATAFFSVFRQRLRAFPETKSILQRLRRRGIKTGVFTDVPYGMPRELVAEDVAMTGLTDDFDVLLSSRDVGWRKPAAATLAPLAIAFGCRPEEMCYVGNERKDVDVARAFGCRAVLIDRGDLRPEWGQDWRITSLEEL